MRRTGRSGRMHTNRFPHMAGGRAEDKKKSLQETLQAH